MGHPVRYILNLEARHFFQDGNGCEVDHFFVALQLLLRVNAREMDGVY